MINYDLPRRLRNDAVTKSQNDIIRENEMGSFSIGDPNHPMYSNGYDYTKSGTIFGYEEKEFLDRQYK